MIVHENALHAMQASLEASRVLRELSEIKSKSPNDFLEIQGNEDECSVHPKMPPASRELEVFVCGAYGARENEGGCCIAQLKTLRKAGYKASLHPTACYSPSSSKMVDDVIKTLNTVIEHTEPNGRRPLKN